VPVADTGANQPILYVVEEDFQPQEMDDISSIKTDAGSLDGEVVEVEARVNQGKLSVQETLEEGTETCGEDLFPVQTPEGTVCVNIAADELLHSGAAWSTVPQSRDQVLTILGASSHEQDQPTTTEEGRYQIVGEVVSSSRIDGRLSDSSVLIIYNMERTGDIDYNEVASEGKNIIETRRDQLRSQLQQQIGEGGVEVTFSRSSKTTGSLSAGESASVSFERTANTDIALERASVSVSTEIDGVEISVGEVSLPEEVEQPPGQSLRTLNISSNAGEDTVANASFELRISREAVSDVADVRVHRYHDGEWIELNTTVVREDESSVVVEAETEGFSYFAVTTEDTTASSGTSGDSETGTTSDGSPGFTPLTLVIAVLSFLGIQLRRLE
jgi:PGF-pre-PGF domain-containing protein